MTNDEFTREDELDENQNDEAQETQGEEQEQTQDESSHEDDKDWKSEALKYKAILDRKNRKPEAKESKKSNDFGYDVMAYLKASGISEKEFDFVKAEKNSSGIGDYASLISNDYFQAKLEKHRAVTKTTEATPKGSRSGGVAVDSVEYWATKPIEEVPQNMRYQVVQAKLKKDSPKGTFYNS